MTGATSFSIIGGIDAARELFAAPGKIRILEHDIDSLKLEIHKLHDYQEMDWEFSRLITSNMDSLDLYKFADDHGVPFEVDIRETGKNKLAFIFEMYIIYPIATGPNGRMYIMLHDSEDQNTYIFKSQ